MRTDYANVHGLATGIRALLKREGLTVGSWKPHGRITSINTFTGGAEVRGLWDEVIISMWDEGRFGNPTLGEVRNVLDKAGIEYRERDGDIYIQADKYVRP